MVEVIDNINIGDSSILLGNIYKNDNLYLSESQIIYLNITDNCCTIRDENLNNIIFTYDTIKFSSKDNREFLSLDKLKLKDIISNKEFSSYENSCTKESNSITSYLRKYEYLHNYFKIKEREFSIEDKLNYEDIFSYKDYELSEIISSFFPEYFYENKTYVEIINLITTKYSLANSLINSISNIYNIDNTSLSYYDYDKFLRLIGIDYDFSNYPIDKLKFLISTYLSIRRNRGTKNSILAILRSMDFNFIDRISEEYCNLYINSIYYPINSSNILRSGVLQISYDNIPGEFIDNVYYMLSKVIPAGIKYFLSNRYISVNDKLTIDFYGNSINENLYNLYVKELSYISDTYKTSKDPVVVSDIVHVKDKYLPINTDNLIIYENSSIEIITRENLYISSDIRNNLSLTDNTGYISDTSTKSILDITYLYIYDEYSINDNLISRYEVIPTMKYLADISNIVDNKYLYNNYIEASDNIGLLIGCKYRLFYTYDSLGVYDSINR